MPKRYSRRFRKMIAELICVQNEGIIKTAEEFGVPLKTVENWVTAYIQDLHCFDDDYISTEQQLEAARKTIKKQKETIEILKSSGLLHERKDKRFRFIMKNSDRYDINLMCECLHVSRSGFYRFFHSRRKRRKEKRTAICMRILAIHASDPLLGSPRITLLLHEEGIMIAQSSVSRNMKEVGIASSTTHKRFRPRHSRISADACPAIVNMVKDIDISSPNIVWTRDIT